MQFDDRKTAGLRALLIHKGTKLAQIKQEIRLCLRALLIHKGTKPVACWNRSYMGLRALLIHKGTKL